MKKEKKKVNIPKIKKKINAFLIGEEGKISKSNLLKAGAVVGSIAIGAGVIGAHSNYLSIDFNDGVVTTSHTSHASHSAHSAHSSHSSHGSHGSHGSHSNSECIRMLYPPLPC